MNNYNFFDLDLELQDLPSQNYPRAEGTGPIRHKKQSPMAFVRTAICHFQARKRFQPDADSFANTEVAENNPAFKSLSR